MQHAHANQHTQAHTHTRRIHINTSGPQERTHVKWTTAAAAGVSGSHMIHARLHYACACGVGWRSCRRLFVPSDTHVWHVESALIR